MIDSRFEMLRNLIRNLGFEGDDFPLCYDESDSRSEPCGEMLVRYFDNPEFENRGNVHDWRNYVPENFRVRWSMLSDESKAALIYTAESQARNEEWE